MEVATGTSFVSSEKRIVCKQGKRAMLHIACLSNRTRQWKSQLTSLKCRVASREKFARGQTEQRALLTRRAKLQSSPATTRGRPRSFASYWTVAAPYATRESVCFVPRVRRTKYATALSVNATRAPSAKLVACTPSTGAIPSAGCKNGCSCPLSSVLEPMRSRCECGLVRLFSVVCLLSSIFCSCPLTRSIHRLRVFAQCRRSSSGS